MNAMQCTWLVLLLCILPLPVRADAPPPAWAWTADATCLGGDAAARAVVDALGGAVQEGIVVRASITGAEGAWTAEIFVSRGEVTRTRSLTSEARACASLSDAVIVVTALLVDEVQAASVPAVLAVPVPRAPPEAPLAVPEGAAPEGASPGGAGPDEASWRGTIRLGAIARFQELPGLAGGPLLEVEVLAPGGIPVLLSAGFWPPVETLSEGRGGRFLGALVMLGVCPSVPLEAAIEVGGCGALSLTYLFASGVGTEETRSAEGISLGVEGRAFLRLRIAAPLWVHAGLGVFVPIVRPRASFALGEGRVLVHEALAVVPEGSLALELRFE